MNIDTYILYTHNELIIVFFGVWADFFLRVFFISLLKGQNKARSKYTVPLTQLLSNGKYQHLVNRVFTQNTIVL